MLAVGEFLMSGDSVDIGDETFRHTKKAQQTLTPNKSIYLKISIS